MSEHSEEEDRYGVAEIVARSKKNFNKNTPQIITTTKKAPATRHNALHYPEKS